TFFEGKISTEDQKVSLRKVEMNSAKLGDEAMISLDSAQPYSQAQTRRLARPLEEIVVLKWEDPVASFEEMRELLQDCSIPFSTD
ncbi:chloromuconate cycloisomerase, partial [Mesorhizobium japonicum]